MDKDPQPFIALQTFVVIFFALLVGGAASGLTYLSEKKLAKSLMAGGAATGAALLFAKTLLQ